MFSFVPSLSSFLFPLSLKTISHDTDILNRFLSTRVGLSAFKNVFFQELMSTFFNMALSNIIYGFLQPLFTTHAKSCVHRIRYCGHSGTWGIVNRTHNILLTSCLILFSFTPIIITDANLIGLRWLCHMTLLFPSIHRTKKATL